MFPCLIIPLAKTVIPNGKSRRVNGRNWLAQIPSFRQENTTVGSLSKMWSNCTRNDSLRQSASNGSYFWEVCDILQNHLNCSQHRPISRFRRRNPGVTPGSFPTLPPTLLSRCCLFHFALLHSRVRYSPPPFHFRRHLRVHFLSVHSLILHVGCQQLRSPLPQRAGISPLPSRLSLLLRPPLPHHHQAKGHIVCSFRRQ